MPTIIKRSMMNNNFDLPFLEEDKSAVDTDGDVTGVDEIISASMGIT